MRGNEVLLVTENFAEAALGAVAAGGATDGGGGGDHAHAGDGNRGRGIRSGWLRSGGPRSWVALFPPEGEGAAVDAAALFADGADVAGPAQVLLGAEAQGSHGETRVENRTLALAVGSESDDGQPLAALGAAGLDHFAAALGRHAGAITDLASTFLAVRAECRLHDF